jgi:hypothetical protein
MEEIKIDKVRMQSDYNKQRREEEEQKRIAWSTCRFCKTMSNRSLSGTQGERVCRECGRVQ